MTVQAYIFNIHWLSLPHISLRFRGLHSSGLVGPCYGLRVEQRAWRAAGHESTTM